MKGRFDRACESDAHPYLMYRVGPSKVHRPEHLEWDGLILDKNDPFRLSHNLPNGLGCKCYIVAVSKGRKERYERDGIPTPVGDNQTPIPKGHRVKASSRTIQIGVKPAVARVKTKAPKTILKHSSTKETELFQKSQSA